MKNFNNIINLLYYFKNNKICYIILIISELINKIKSKD